MKEAKRETPGTKPMSSVEVPRKTQRRRTFRQSGIALQSQFVAAVKPTRSSVFQKRDALAVARLTASRELRSARTATKSERPRPGVPGHALHGNTRRSSGRGSIVTGMNPMLSASLAAAAIAARRRQSLAHASLQGPNVAAIGDSHRQGYESSRLHTSSQYVEELDYRQVNPINFKNSAQSDRKSGSRKSILPSKSFLQVSGTPGAKHSTARMSLMPSIGQQPSPDGRKHKGLARGHPTDIERGRIRGGHIISSTERRVNTRSFPLRRGTHLAVPDRSNLRSQN